MLIAQQDTAIDCYHGLVKELSKGQRGDILYHMRSRRDFCLSEIAESLDMPPGTVSARCTELRKAGLIRWTGRKRESWASGVTCKTLELVPAQGRLC